MKTVLLERKLPGNPLPEDSLFPVGAFCCDSGLVQWLDSFSSQDGSHAYLTCRAPDLESIRVAIRMCDGRVRWKYAVYDYTLRNDIIPNMAIEISLPDYPQEPLPADPGQPLNSHLQTRIQACMPSSIPVKVLRMTAGNNAMVFAYTNDSKVQPVPGIMVKSLQALRQPV